MAIMTRTLQIMIKALQIMTGILLIITRTLHIMTRILQIITRALKNYETKIIIKNMLSYLHTWKHKKLDILSYVSQNKTRNKTGFAAC